MNPKKNKWLTSWITTIIYIDIETGEILNKNNYNKNYITIKTTKNAKKSYMGSGGIKTIYKYGEKNKQIKLFNI